jgi:hypothetical protein
MTTESQPKAIWEGEIVVMGIPLRCFVLEDGRRIIDADSMVDFLESLVNLQPGTDSEFAELVQFLHGGGIPTFERRGP